MLPWRWRPTVSLLQHRVSELTRKMQQVHLVDADTYSVALMVSSTSRVPRRLYTWCIHCLPRPPVPRPSTYSTTMSLLLTRYVSHLMAYCSVTCCVPGPPYLKMMQVIVTVLHKLCGSSHQWHTVQSSVAYLDCDNWKWCRWQQLLHKHCESSN